MKQDLASLVVFGTSVLACWWSKLIGDVSICEARHIYPTETEAETEQTSNLTELVGRAHCFIFEIERNLCTNAVVNLL